MADSSDQVGLRGRILEYFGIEEGEWTPTVLLTLNLLLALASVIALKAASDSLFLSRFDARRLPWVDLSITFLVGGVVGYYIRLSNRMPLGRLIALTQVFLAGNILIFWLLLRSQVFGSRAVLYVWVGVFSVLLPSQVWSLASNVFTTRQAKRLYSIIGSGGILGAAVGGEVASVVGPRLGTETVLWIAAFSVASCGILALRISRSFMAPSEGTGARSPLKNERGSVWDTLALVRTDRYLTLITLGIFLSTIVTTLIKYQFKAIAKESYAADPAALTSFFGDFYGYIALISFLFHVLFSGRIMRWLGLGASLFILPSSLLFGAAAVFLFAPTGFSLWSVILARGLDQGLRHSVDRASIELLYVPMATRLRAQVKSFLDLAVSRWADAIASVVLLIVVNLLHFATGQISWASVLFICFWLAVVWKLRGEYVLTLRNTIERRDLNAEEILRKLASSEQSVSHDLALEMADQQSLEISMEWMQFTGAVSGQGQLAELLTHSSPAIRRKALGVVAAQNVPDCEKQIIRFLEMDDDTAARWQAMEYLGSEESDTGSIAIEQLLQAEDQALAATAAAKLLTLTGGEHEQAARILQDYLRNASQGTVSERATAARLLGMAPAALDAADYIGELLRDENAEVVRAVLPAVGIHKRTEVVPKLVNLLANRQLRREAREALASFGRGILETLNSLLGDRSLPLAVRKEIPRVMSAIGGPNAARLLLSNLSKDGGEFGRPVLRELARLRRGDSKLSFYPEAVSGLITAEIEKYYREAAWLDGIADNGKSGVRFLRRAILERMQNRVEGIFQLLSLIYPHREILDAYHWVKSGRKDLRANALEFLDTRLENPIRQMFLPMIEDEAGRRLAQSGRDLFGTQRLPFPAVLRRLLEHGDPWIQSLASYAAAEARAAELAPLVKPLAQSRDPLLAETAAAAHGRLAAFGGDSVQRTL